MGRFVKNVEIKAASNAIRLPSSTAANGPTSPVDAQVRVNTTNGKLEVYFNSVWSTVATVGRVPIIKDQLVGDGIVTAFTMTSSYTVGDNTAVLVFVGNVFQNPTETYAVSGTSITFTEPPSTGVPIVILHNLSSTGI